MKIDWNEAPEWVVAHALYTFANQITPVWVGVDQWMDVVRGKPFPYGGGVGEARHNPTRSQFQYETPRPAPWTGEGLPPVGTVCDWQASTQHEWKRVTVIAYNGIDVWLHPVGIVGNPAGFRPIRTPEQIAAEERAQGIQEMREAAGSLNNFPFEQLYDAGYRKQVKP